MPLKSLQPIPLDRRSEPFTHPDWLFEVKWDGFRSLVCVENGRCTMASRNGNEFKSFPDLNASIAQELRAHSVLMDGEIVCLNTAGKSVFRDLLFRRGVARFYAFDLLLCDGEDLRYRPLHERKARLRSIIRRGEHLLYCDHIEADGEALFRLACDHDLEGIIAKHKYAPYLPDHAQWFKIRNRRYSQWEGREELFERERTVTPDTTGWSSCVAACAELG